MFLIFMAVLSGSLPLSPRVLARFPNCDEDTSSSATSNRFMAPADNQASVSPLSARPVRDVGYFGPERVSTGMIDQPFGSQLPFRAPRRLLLKPGPWDWWFAAGRGNPLPFGG